MCTFVAFNRSDASKKEKSPKILDIYWKDKLINVSLDKEAGLRFSGCGSHVKRNGWKTRINVRILLWKVTCIHIEL